MKRATVKPSARQQRARYVIGVDVGGTFTDVFFLDEQAGKAFINKVPSTGRRGGHARGGGTGQRSPPAAASLPAGEWDRVGRAPAMAALVLRSIDARMGAQEQACFR